ncbi:MAG TPA: DNA polymerase III subunit delta [Phycisphaerales bacterium]|nr:DNA polymerase III subunit delta [Phycisphaerales bacterium]
MAKRSSTKSAAVELNDTMRMVVLYGSEMMLKRQYFQQLRDIMEKAHGEVQTIQFNASDSGLAEVFDELRSYGLMQQYKLVVVDEADEFVKDNRDALTRYAENPVDHGTLVLRSGKWNKGNLDKAINKVGCLIKCDAPTPAVAATWLVSQAKNHKCKLDKATAQVLVGRIGCDLMRLDAELAKLSLLVEPGAKIDEQLIDQVVGRSSDEQAWAVQEAILQALSSGSSLGKTAGGKAIEKVHELVDLSNQHEVLVLYFVADLIRKLNMALQMRKAGAADAEIARQMKLWGARQTLFMSLLRRLPENRAGALLDRVVKADAGSKSGLGNAMRNLECFCTILSDALN